jgi:hypothetical protein
MVVELPVVSIHRWKFNYRFTYRLQISPGENVATSTSTSLIYANFPRRITLFNAYLSRQNQIFHSYSDNFPSGNRGTTSIASLKQFAERSLFPRENTFVTHVFIGEIGVERHRKGQILLWKLKFS